MLKRLWKNEFIQGGVWVTLSFTLGNFLNYLFNFLAARNLGPADYSEITALFSYVNIFSVPITVITMIITQKVSAADEHRFTYAASVDAYFYQRLKRWWPLIILSLITIPAIPAVTNLSPFSSIMLIPYIFFNFYLYYYLAIIQGLRLFIAYAFLIVASPFIKLLGALLIMFGLGDLEVVLVFLFLSVALTALISYVVTKDSNQEHHAHTNMLDRRLFSIFTTHQFIITTVSILALTLLNNLDIVFVKKYFTAAEAGFYSSWSLYSKVILYGTGPLTAVSFIFFSSSKQSGSHKKALYISIAILLVVGAVSYIFYTRFAAIIITLLFGKKFEAIAPYLGQASLFGTLYALITYLNNYFIARNHKAALIIPSLLPFYIVGLYISERTLNSVMNLNIMFSLVAVAIYTVVFIYTSVRAKTS